MGSLQAAEFAALPDRPAALRWHLQHNHYPPLPLSILPAVEQAIARANAGEWNERVPLPDGVLWRGETSAPVHVCIEGWHLGAFLDTDDER